MYVSALNESVTFSLAKLRARSAPAQLQMYMAFYLANLLRHFTGMPDCG